MSSVLVSLESGVLRVTLNRPDKLNAFNPEMHQLLRKALEQARDEAAVRAVLLTGAGRGFCAGQDLSERNVAADAPIDLSVSLGSHYNPLVRRLRELPKPVVCAVNGVAAGAGANIALACDLVIAARSASFVQSFSRLGLVPDSGGTWFLPRLLGSARAMGLALLGEKLTAEQAQEWGLIWKVVDDDKVAVTVETPGGIVTMVVISQSDDSALVEVEMGRASFRSAAVGLNGPDREVDGEMLELEAGDRVPINTVSIGNPHCVIFEDEVDVDDLRRRAPQISTHPWFERGTNVQFAHPLGGSSVEAWVWERGAGETSASGSSACAVAAAAVRRGLVSSREVEVRMPGGVLEVRVGEAWDLVLRGPVEAVYEGEFLVEMLNRLSDL